MAAKYTALHVITPHRFGGAERIVANLSWALAERGHRIVVAAPTRVPSFLGYLDDVGIEHRPVAISGKVNPLAAGRIARLAREIGADLIHTHLSSASIHGVKAARKLDLPVIGHVHGMNSLRWYRGATVVLVGTEGVGRNMLAQGLAEDELRLVHYGIPMEPFDHLQQAEALRKQWGIDPPDRVLAIVAGVVKRKGHAYLLEAAAKLRGRHPRVRCMIIGSGPEMPALKAHAERLGIADRVLWLGWQQDALSPLQLADVHVLPATEVEGFGLCIIEAAVLGVPTVASNMPGVDEAVLDGRTGLLVPPCDSDALAKALGRLLDDEDLRRKLGEAAQTRARKEFDIRTMAAGVEKLYGELVGR